MEIRFKCVKSFSFELLDEHDSFTGETGEIEEGTIWETYEDEDFAGDIRLHQWGEVESGQTLYWVEVGIDTFYRCFERVGESE